MKEHIIIDIAIIIVCVMIVLVSFSIIKKNNTVAEVGPIYVQKWVSPETGVCYYVSGYTMCPIYNEDGSLYIEK